MAKNKDYNPYKHCILKGPLDPNRSTEWERIVESARAENLIRKKFKEDFSEGQRLYEEEQFRLSWLGKLRTFWRWLTYGNDY